MIQRTLGLLFVLAFGILAMIVKAQEPVGIVPTECNSFVFGPMTSAWVREDSNTRANQLGSLTTGDNTAFTLYPTNRGITYDVATVEITSVVHDGTYNGGDTWFIVNLLDPNGQPVVLNGTTPLVNVAIATRPSTCHAALQPIIPEFTITGEYAWCVEEIVFDAEELNFRTETNQNSASYEVYVQNNALMLPVDGTDLEIVAIETIAVLYNQGSYDDAAKTNSWTDHWQLTDGRTWVQVNLTLQDNTVVDGLYLAIPFCFEQNRPQGNETE